MEAALVSVSTGVMGPLISKLTNLLVADYAKLKGIRNQVVFLRDELSAMSAALQMLGDSPEAELNPVMKDWRDKLRELAYDIEDCIDDFMARVGLNNDEAAAIGFNFKGLVAKFKKMMAIREIANEIEQLKARAIEASERHKRYDFTEQSSTKSSSNFGIDPRLPALYEEIDNLVGIQSPMERIIDLLTTTESRLRVISIAGCGGLGKTTLANQAFRTIRSQFMCVDSQKEKKFICGAFVTVSRNPNMRKVLRAIAQGVGIPEKTSKNDDEQQLIGKLKQHLQDKRYFVAIDDIWDAKAWEVIKLALLDNNRGSRIIATTRSLTVASCCSSQGGYVYALEPLSFNDSKRLFVKRAFGSEDCSYPHLKDVLNKILGKCSGLPLAIITIASMLTDQQARSEWDRVANAIGSALAKNPHAEKMMSIMSLSYVDVPQHVRTCLLYLSVFPEDYQITKKSLINRWIAEGFIHEEQGMSTYEIGERYFNDLINRSLIQPIDVKFGQAKACRVHDIILDYLKCKAAEENFVISLDARENNGYTSEYKVRRLCVYKPSTENVTLSTSLVLSHVRSLTIFRDSIEAYLLPFPNGTSLLPFTALHVLDLYNCLLMQHHHLLHIEKLFHLKYLSLGWSDSPIPDKVCDLQYLETLDVRRCMRHWSVCLPTTMGKLQRLTHLYVHYRTTFPDGIIGQMCSLEELSKYGVLYEQGKQLQEFSKLTKLKTLKIRWRFGMLNKEERRNQVEVYHSYVGSLLSSCNLNSLHITNKSTRFYPLLLDSWHPTAACSLQRFHLKGCDTFKVPNWMGSLGNLGVLEMSILCISPQDIKILGAIPSLHSLELRTVGGTNGKIFIRGSNRFQSLKYFSLTIGLCGTALEFEAGSEPKLEQLQLWFCLHKMECVNYASDFGIQHLSALNMVKVSIGGDCFEDTKYNPAEDEDDSTIRCVAGAIKAAIDMLPNRPILQFDIWHDNDCESFKSGLKQHNQDNGGALTEWLKVWQIEEDQHTLQVTP